MIKMEVPIRYSQKCMLACLIIFLLNSKPVPAADPHGAPSLQSASADSKIISRPADISSSAYFMATSGSDANDGTIDHPWHSLDYLLSNLSAGDVLYIRSGTYFEQDMNIQLSGTAGEPILIQSYPGEQAEISGAIANLREANNGNWTLVDGGINLYKSVHAYEPQAYMNAWLTDDDLHLITYGETTDYDSWNNLMWSVGAGVSGAFDSEFSSNNGDVYIHHNIIDFSFYQHGGREGNYREDHWPVWQVIHAFAHHGDSYGARWKVYNNTVIGRKSGYEWNPAGLPDGLYGNDGLYVYNNIFFVTDDRIIFSDYPVSSGAHYDGNVVFRRNPEKPEKFPLFYKFGNGENYTSLDNFRANSGTGWEQNGLETDPAFDLTALENTVYARGQMRKRYTPANPVIFTEGMSYAALSWPGISDIN